MIVMALTTLQPMKPIHIFGAWNWPFSRGSAIVPSPTCQSPSRPTLHVVEGGLGKDQISRKRSGPVVPYVEIATRRDFQNQMLQPFQYSHGKKQQPGLERSLHQARCRWHTFQSKIMRNNFKLNAASICTTPHEEGALFCRRPGMLKGKTRTLCCEAMWDLSAKVQTALHCDAGPSCISRQPSGAAMKSRPTHAGRPIVIHSMDRPKQHVN